MYFPPPKSTSLPKWQEQILESIDTLVVGNEQEM
jgi:hypothetical protein